MRGDLRTWGLGDLGNNYFPLLVRVPWLLAKQQGRTAISLFPYLISLPSQGNNNRVELRMKKINITITEFEGDQLEINLNLDRPQFSICPKCSAQVIQLSEGCTACGWLEVQPKPIIKTRRQPGEGSGHIYYRTVNRNGRDYQQAYYQWRDNGKQKTKYIPNKLLNEIKQAESRKLPVEDILVLLLGTGKCSSKKSKDRCSSKIIPSSKNSEDKCSSKKIPSSKKRRDQGKGSGWIRCKPIKRKGKS